MAVLVQLFEPTADGACHTFTLAQDICLTGLPYYGAWAVAIIAAISGVFRLAWSVLVGLAE